MKRFMRSLIESFLKSFAIMLLIACVACFVLALISLLMMLNGQATWKLLAIFAVSGVLSGMVCFVISDLL